MHEHDRIRFSIVVPAYNEAGYLGCSLTSLQDQDFAGPYEIIVVDNNSTDDTAAVAAGYGVRVVNEPEQGVCAARQRGAEVSNGEIIVSVDADTVYPSDWLSTIDERFTASEEIVAVAGPCRFGNPSWWSKSFPHHDVRDRGGPVRADRIRRLCERDEHRHAPVGVSRL